MSSTTLDCQPLTARIPAEMRRKNQWVRWRIEPRAAGEAATKMPYQVGAERRAKSNDPSTWGTATDAITNAQRHGMAGVGYMFAPDSGEVGIDLDGCRDPQSGAIAEWAQPILAMFRATYAEISPSRTGIKIFCRGKLPTDKTGRKEAFLDREHCGLEAYQHGRFFVVTGDVVEGHPRELADCQAGIDHVWNMIDELRAAKKPATKQKTTEQPADEVNPFNIEPPADTGSDWTPIMRRCWAYLRKMPDAISGRGGHDATFGAACECFRFGLADEQAFAVMARFNAEKTGGECWSDDELRHKLADARQTVRAAGELGVRLSQLSIWTAEHRTDVANGKRLVQQHGADLRWVGAWDRWLVFDGQRWQLDVTCATEARAKDVAAGIWRELDAATKRLGVPDAAEDKAQLAAMRGFARSSSSVNGLRNAVAAARSELGMAITHEQLDCDFWTFNVANGTIDLRTGKLRQHERADYISRLCPVVYDPDADCPRWLRFLSEITNGDGALQSYLQKLVGYSLTGSTRDHVLPFLWGQGANGKSVFVNTVMALLGSDYAMRAAPELMMARHQDAHPTERADLFRKRLVVSNEIEAGRRLNESLVKDLTGGDRVRARRMREDFWEFDPTHKIWLVGNHKPVIRGTDVGIWRRLKLIPFTRVFAPAEQDRELPAKLLAELPGVLNWAILGCLDWQRDGLGEPEAVRRATCDYRAGEDIVGEFIADACVVDPGARVRASHLYGAYRRWAEQRGEKVASNRMFGEEVAKRHEKKSSNGLWYVGIGLAAEG